MPKAISELYIAKLCGDDTSKRGPKHASFSRDLGHTAGIQVYVVNVSANTTKTLMTLAQLTGYHVM